MIFLIANWVMLIPVACGLAISLVLSSDMVERPQDSWVRLSLRITVWTLLIFALIGFCLRATPLHFFWIIVLLAFASACWIWNYRFARHALMLVVLATRGDTQRLMAVTHYLLSEGRGYWRRKAWRLRAALAASYHWSAAATQAGLATEAQTRLALGLLKHDPGGTQTVRDMLTEGTVQRIALIRMTHRLVAASVSLLALAAFGATTVLLIMPTMGKMAQDYGHMISDRGLWQTLFLDGHVYLWFPLIIWLVVGLISVILLFPRLTRHIPLVWLDMGYYRGLTLQGCACMLRINPRAADVCRAVAEALPIPLWSARLRLAASAIDAGMPAPQALNQQRILHADEARVLALGRTPQAWAWTLEEIARTQRERSMARLDLGSQIASVLIVLISGGLIAVLAVALLGSLTNWVLHVVP